MATVSSAIKRPLGGLGKFLMIGGIVLMVAMIANVFLQIPLFALVISSMFIVFSSLMILWQLNAIVTGGEDNYISATLTLVVSIYNIFQALFPLLQHFRRPGRATVQTYFCPSRFTQSGPAGRCLLRCQTI